MRADSVVLLVFCLIFLFLPATNKWLLILKSLLVLVKISVLLLPNVEGFHASRHLNFAAYN